MQTDEEIGKVAAAVPVIICILSVRVSHKFYKYSLNKYRKLTANNGNMEMQLLGWEKK